MAVLRLCREAGLIRLGLVALDGTKVRANAALDANRTASSVDEQVAKMLAEAEAADAQEDRQFGAQRGNELPAALVRRGDRLARLRQCQDKLQRRAADAASRQQEKIEARAAVEKASGKRKRGRKPKPADPAVDPDTVANVTDPDSGIMKTRHGWLQGYNAQIVVTVGQIILAADGLGHLELDFVKRGVEVADRVGMAHADEHEDIAPAAAGQDLVHSLAGNDRIVRRAARNGCPRIVDTDHELRRCWVRRGNTAQVALRRDEDILLLDGGVRGALDDITEGRPGDHPRRRRIEAFVQPEEPVSGAQRAELVGDDRLEGRTDIRARRMVLGETTDKQIDLVNASVYRPQVRLHQGDCTSE
jgi:hypothetical protein